MFTLSINSSVTHLINRDDEDLTIKEALQTIYPYTEESAIYMNWNGCILELWLCAEISDLFNDIIQMLNNLTSEKEFNIYWGSNIFFGKWFFSKEKDNIIKIESDLTQLRGGKESISRLGGVDNFILINKIIFIKEWLKLLEQIKSDLEKTGYNKDNLEDFYLLENLGRFLK